MWSRRSFGEVLVRSAVEVGVADEAPRRRR